MMVLTVIMIAMVAGVSATFGLERRLHVYKIRSEAMEQILDHVVGPNAKNLVSDFRRQMPISQMPRKARELTGVFMPHFDQELGRGLNPEPSPILELQAISISHCNRLRQVKKDIFAMIGGQANAAAMARVKIEGERARRFLLRPMPGGSMG